MSKKKGRPSARSAPAPVIAPQAPDRPGRARWLIAGGLMVVAATVAGGYWFTHRGAPGTYTFPSPRKPAPSARIGFEDFTGSETCAECHAEQYAGWKESTHGRAGGPPAPERVIAPFNGHPL